MWKLLKASAIMPMLLDTVGYCWIRITDCLQAAQQHSMLHRLDFFFPDTAEQIGGSLKRRQQKDLYSNLHPRC